jgi:predicted neutral ceramidase superfamily lipid hydrolase
MNASTVEKTRYLYVAAIVLWVFLVWYLDLWSGDRPLSLMINAIPPVVFLWALANLSSSKVDMRSILQSDHVAFTVLVIAFIAKGTNIIKNERYLKIIVVSLFFLMLSIIEVISSLQDRKHQEHLSDHLRDAADSSRLYGLS